MGCRKIIDEISFWPRWDFGFCWSSTCHSKSKENQFNDNAVGIEAHACNLDAPWYCMRNAWRKFSWRNMHEYKVESQQKMVERFFFYFSQDMITAIISNEQKKTDSSRFVATCEYEKSHFRFFFVSPPPPTLNCIYTELHFRMSNSNSNGWHKSAG